MNSEEIRQKFLDFFEKNNHKIVPSSSLLPTDPSVLLTTAGVQQFKPYYTGQLDPEKDFSARRVASVQKCFRTTDIDDVGDKTHLTFFEMLGNFCFNDYWKKEAIGWNYEFLTQELKISPERIYVSIFQGSDLIPKDEESYHIWHKEISLSKEKIKLAGLEDNFWGPTGNGGPCGPTTEIYVDGVEIWNIVFNEYYCYGIREQLLKGEAKLDKLMTNGIDTGMGLERLVAVINGVEDIYETDLLHPLLSKINKLEPQLTDRQARILTDHLRSSIFLIADGIRPMNKEAGYILRRLLRRIMAYQLNFSELVEISTTWVKEKYGQTYPEARESDLIAEVMLSEQAKFGKVLKNGLAELKNYPEVTAKEAFYLYESYGLPFELIKEMAPEKSGKLKREEFDDALERHRQLSRAGVEKKFGGHGLILDTGELKAGSKEELEKVIRLHTATHLLQQALRDVLGAEVKQSGSDITAERTRFDFSFSRKMTTEEIKKVEDKVNEMIAKDLPVAFEQMPKDQAMKTGALFYFKEKYPKQVKVYYIGHSIEDSYSKEFCGGPHVDHTLQIGQFKILKEEAVGAGVRRIRSTVE